MITEPIFVTLLGKKNAVSMPDFATREDLIQRYAAVNKKGGVPLMRVYSACLGLCTRIGRESGADFAACSYDVLGYGGAIYSFLREQGVEPKDIIAAAIPVLGQVAEQTYPRQKEVVEAEKN